MCKFALYAHLPKSKRDQRRHINALARMTGATAHKDVFDHLYGCLSILDSKSASLLTVNSIVLAVFAIFLSNGLPGVQLATIYVGMVALLLSSAFLMVVVWVHWSTTEDLNDPKRHELTLLAVRTERTVKYRLAWYFAVLSLITLGALLLEQAGARLLC